MGSKSKSKTDGCKEESQDFSQSTTNESGTGQAQAPRNGQAIGHEWDSPTDPEDEGITVERSPTDESEHSDESTSDGAGGPQREWDSEAPVVRNVEQEDPRSDHQDATHDRYGIVNDPTEDRE